MGIEKGDDAAERNGRGQASRVLQAAGSLQDAQDRILRDGILRPGGPSDTTRRAFIARLSFKLYPSVRWVGERLKKTPAEIAQEAARSAAELEHFLRHRPPAAGEVVMRLKRLTLPCGREETRLLVYRSPVSSLSLLEVNALRLKLLRLLDHLGLQPRETLARWSEQWLGAWAGLDRNGNPESLDQFLDRVLGSLPILSGQVRTARYGLAVQTIFAGEFAAMRVLRCRDCGAVWKHPGANYCHRRGCHALIAAVEPDYWILPLGGEHYHACFASRCNGPLCRAVLGKKGRPARKGLVYPHWPAGAPCPRGDPPEWRSDDDVSFSVPTHAAAMEPPPQPPEGADRPPEIQAFLRVLKKHQGADLSAEEICRLVDPAAPDGILEPIKGLLAQTEDQAGRSTSVDRLLSVLDNSEEHGGAHD